MADKDASEKALEELLAGLSDSPKSGKTGKEEEKKPPSATQSRDAIGEKISEVDEMAAGLQELLSSASIAEEVAASKVEEEARVAEDKIEMEDMESALASALAIPAAAKDAGSFDDIEETWEEAESPVAVAVGEPQPVAAVDMAALYQPKAAVEEVVVVEPEKLSEKRKRFYAKKKIREKCALVRIALQGAFAEV